MNPNTVPGKFATLEALVQSVRARAVQKKKPFGGKRDLKAQSESAEQRAANAIAKAIEEELKWQPQSLVMLSLHQRCDCGQSYRSILGLFLESKHADHGALRKRPPADLQAIDRLPHKWEEINEEIGICPNCLLERDTIHALMFPIHDACVQLPLFDHQLQKRACI